MHSKYFDSLLNGDLSKNIKRDEQGYIFIDHDPYVFEVLLRYMRTNLLDFKDIQLSTIEDGANFYCIDNLLTDQPIAKVINITHFSLIIKILNHKLYFLTYFRKMNRVILVVTQRIKE